LQRYGSSPLWHHCSLQEAFAFIAQMLNFGYPSRIFPEVSIKPEGITSTTERETTTVSQCDCFIGDQYCVEAKRVLVYRCYFTILLIDCGIEVICYFNEPFNSAFLQFQISPFEIGSLS
jgi:hypothetical protein